jgi:branched-chain amino acid transport system substrate-binding protein
VGPISGEQASLGREIHRARLVAEAELETKEHNSNVVIREVDTASTPAVARVEVARVMESWHPEIIVGSIISAETREFLPLALERDLVVVANGSSDPAIRDLPFRTEGDSFFRNWPADDFEGRVMAEYLRASGRADSLVILQASDPYAAGLVAAFKARFEELGGKILGLEVYPLDLSNFEALLRRQPMTDIDGYYIIGFPPDVSAIYNTIRRTENIKSLPIYSAAGASTGEFSNLVNGPVDNVFFTSPEVDETAGIYFDFRVRYQEMFKDEQPDIVSAITYDAIEIALRSIEVAGCERKAIRDFLHGEFIFEGTTGLTQFDQFGDVVTKEVSIEVYEEGRRIMIEKRRANAGAK